MDPVLESVVRLDRGVENDKSRVQLVVRTGRMSCDPWWVGETVWCDQGRERAILRYPVTLGEKVRVNLVIVDAPVMAREAYWLTSPWDNEQTFGGYTRIRAMRRWNPSVMPFP